MALTLKEKSDLATGVILLANEPLSFWMQQKLVDYAQDWHNSLRPIGLDLAVPLEAKKEAIYKKIDQFCDEILRIEAVGNRGLYNATTRLMADIIGDSSATLAQVVAATEAQTESTFDSNIAQIFYRGARLNRDEVLIINP